MSVTILIGTMILGGFGAVFRFVLDGAVSTRKPSDFPFGTLAVNLLGALILGFLVGSDVSGDVTRLLAVGLLGGFTTFSTLMFETQRLAEDGLIRVAAANVGVSMMLGVLAIWIGKIAGGLL
ncbi:MAG: fluoride efflux transporter CrcB [Solirubrobacterales bacterium]